MRILMLILLTSVMLFSAEEVALPRDAQKILNVLSAQIADLQEKAVKDLKKVQDDQTKAGKLDEAVAIRNIVTAIEKKVDESKGVIVEVPSKYKFLGTWATPNGESLTFAADKTITGTCNNTAWNKGTWDLNKEGDTITLTISNGEHKQFTIVDDTKLFLTGGNPPVWTRKQ